MSRSPIAGTLAQLWKLSLVIPLVMPVALLAAGCSSRRDERPDVILLVLDTWRPDQLAAFGASTDHTPALTRQLEGARRFQAAQSTCSWTAPALISLVSSLPTAAHGVRGAPHPGRLADEVQTLPELLREAGWRTAAFTEGGYAKGEFGLDQGFELFPPFADDSHETHSIQGHESRIRANVDRSLNWLAEQGDQPLLFLFHTYQVHTPYRADEAHVRELLPEFRDAQEEAELERIVAHWNRERSMTREDWLRLQQRRLRTGRIPPVEAPLELIAYWRERGLGPQEVLQTPELIAHARALYAACLRHADRELERLFAGLRRREQQSGRPQVLLVVSDHGEGLGDHGELEHGTSLYQSLTRIVLALRAPGVAAGDEPQPVSLLDAAPTVLRLCGLHELPESFQGGDLLQPAAERALHSHGMTVAREADLRFAVRRGRWHLIFDTATQRSELYDLAADPGELHDRAAEEPRVLAALLEELRREEERNRELHARYGAATAGRTLDERTRRELKGLGYIGEEAPSSR
jgi:arylsulfatase A-like enzyme